MPEHEPRTDEALAELYSAVPAAEEIDLREEDELEEIRQWRDRQIVDHLRRLGELDPDD